MHAGNADRYLYGAVPDFRSAAFSRLLALGIQYGIILVLAALLGRWRGRPDPASYGLTRGGRRWSGLLGTGVGSFLFVPLCEELFTRGYLLGRVREAFSAGGSLIAMAVFFSFAHGQYRHVDPLSLGSELGLLLWSMALGYAVYRTESLLPAFVAHVMINVPIVLSVRWAALAISLLALVIGRRAVASWIRGFLRTFRAVDWAATTLAVAAIVLLLTTIRLTSWMPFVWLGVLGLVSAVGLFGPSPWARRRPIAVPE